MRLSVVSGFASRILFDIVRSPLVDVDVCLFAAAVLIIYLSVNLLWVLALLVGFIYFLLVVFVLNVLVTLRSYFALAGCRGGLCLITCS